MSTTRPSVLTISPTQFILQPIVVESTTSSLEIKNAIMATRCHRCHSRSVRRQTLVVPFAMIASAVSSLLQVKKPSTTPRIIVRSSQERERITCVELYTCFVCTEYSHSFLISCSRRSLVRTALLFARRSLVRTALLLAL
jgi:hypothetical protein